MSLLLNIIYVLLAIIGVILLIVFWILTVPRHFWVEYSKQDGFNAKVNILFFKINIWPLPKMIAKYLNKKDNVDEQSEEPKMPTQDSLENDFSSDDLEKSSSSSKKTENNSSPPESKPFIDKKSDEGDLKEDEEIKEKKKIPFIDDIAISFDLVKDLIKSASGIVKIILKKLKFSDVSFNLPLNAGNAYDTQKLYSKTVAAYHGFNAVANQYTTINYKSPLFIADFADQYSESTYLYAKITIKAGLIFALLVYIIKQLLFIFKNHKKPKQDTKL